MKQLRGGMIDKGYLLSALELAYLRKGACSPNPSVGAVVVKNNHIIAEGYHEGPGLPHAEPTALSQLSDEDAKDSTIYVTLEPCCHHGRTPPCTELLIKKKVARVVYGYQDPNPIVSGRGHEKLTAAGIICDYQALPEIQTFYESYAYWHKHKRPFLTAKLAVSADGKIAGEGGVPVKITGDLTNQFTHQQRKMSDAILTSVKTIIQDDPQLNVRIHPHPGSVPQAGEGVNKSNTFYSLARLRERVGVRGLVQPKPVYVLDRSLQFPLAARVMQTAKTITLFYDKLLDISKTFPFTKHGVFCVPVPCRDSKLELEFILDYLGNQGLHDVWLEAGAILFKAFVLSGLAQRVYLYRALCQLGGAAYAANLPASFEEGRGAQASFFLGKDRVILTDYK